MYSPRVIALVALFGSVNAQVAGYGQCRLFPIGRLHQRLTGNIGGGSGYSGSTTCTSGFYCASQNPCKTISREQWMSLSHDFIGYYQCIPGTTTASTTTTSKATVTTTTTTSSTSTTLKTTTTAQTATQTSTSTGAATCTGTFSAISASDFVAKLHPGWNLGNTLDATPNEGSWNNAPVVASTFSAVQKAGFRSVRIPGKLSVVPH